jgi:ribonucleoside-diphosphate reductase alpha chain
MMDNAIDLSRFPLAAQAEQARGTRRIGLGLTGLGDSLILLGLHYGSDAARETAARVMQTICHAAYRASIDLAREKGPFAFFERARYLEGPFVRRLPDDVRDGIARHGIRNSHLTAIAPTGTISLLANNVSSGLEPVYDFALTRRVLERDASYASYALTDYASARWRALRGDAAPPPSFVSAHELSPQAHLAMQAALQPYVDSSISKTINVPRDYAFDDFAGIYQQAYDLGLKGCTTFRPNPVTGAVLSPLAEGESAPHCCNVEREAD